MFLTIIRVISFLLSLCLRQTNLPKLVNSYEEFNNEKLYLANKFCYKTQKSMK